MSDLREVPNEPIILHNTVCGYCGARGDAANPLTSEHVIGRKFVPRGSLAKGWSLIFRACKNCNNQKSDLEDDISAITLLPDLGKQHTDPQLTILAKRKAEGAFSRRTKKPVASSEEQTSIAIQSVGADMRIGFVAPPQIDANRVHQLARFHVQAFFYLITYYSGTGIGGFFPGSILFFPGARRSDWGNSLFRSFSEITRSWSKRLIGSAAEGFFRVAIRREPSGDMVWSFALEWNKSYRIVGFFGNTNRAQEFGGQLRWPKMYVLSPTERYRPEVPLLLEDDVLFD